MNARHWWNAPPDQMFRAYYMLLRTVYEMPASEALAMARRNRETLGLGQPGGFIGRMRTALLPNSQEYGQ